MEIPLNNKYRTQNSIKQKTQQKNNTKFHKKCMPTNQECKMQTFLKF